MPDPRSALAAEVLARGGDTATGAPLADLVRRRADQLAAGGAHGTSGRLHRIEPRPDGQELVDVLACWSLGAVAWLSSGGAPEPDPDLVPDTAAVLQETSGSTGTSRGVVRSADSLVVEAAGYQAGLDLRAGERVRVPVPTTHSFGCGVALAGLLAGCSIDARPMVRPRGVAGDLDGGRVDLLAVTPSAAALVARTARTGPHRPRAVLVGAGAVPDDLDSALLERFGVRAVRGYGSTETGGTFLGTDGIGRPVAGVEVLAPDLGAQGELVLRLAAPVLGYVGQDAPASTDWRTGDIVDRSPDGTVRWLRRRSGPVRLNGRFVDPAPLLAAVADVAGVEEATVVVTRRPGWTGVEDLTVVTAGATVDPDAVRRALAAHGDRDLVVQLRALDALPRSVLGKLDRPALERWVASGVS